MSLTKVFTSGNTGAHPDDTLATIKVWSEDFPPPLPSGPRPNVRRVSQNSEYYMNEGEDPEKPYQSIPPYLSMAGFSAHQHLHPPPARNNYVNFPAEHTYDTVSDEGKVSKATTPEEEYVLIPDGNCEGYVEVTGKINEAEDHNYINTREIEDSDSAEKTSNNEYVIVPSTHGPISPPDIPTTDDPTDNFQPKQ